MKYIWLKLASPLQSWGGDARSFEVRPTNNMPTFSGILGLICSCLGISFRKEFDKVKNLRDDIKMDIFPLSKNVYSILKDYQGAGGSLNKKDTYQKRGIPMYSGGKQNLVFHKHYLQDCKFDIILEIKTESLALKISEALKKPKWMPFLGRKACHLSELPFGGVFSSKEEIKDIWEREKRLHGHSFSHMAEITNDCRIIKDYPMCRGTNSTTVRLVKECL